MQHVIKNDRGQGLIEQQLLNPLGRAFILMIATLNPQNLAGCDWKEFVRQCKTIIAGSFPLISFSAVFVGIALTCQTVIELQRYEAQSLAGSVISLALLRELGPLIVGLAWVAWGTAYMAHQIEMLPSNQSNAEFAKQVVFPRYLACLAMAVPLATYGMIIGLLTGAFVSASISDSSIFEFFGGAKRAIEDKDLFVYFAKIVLICPTLAVFSACAFFRNGVDFRQRSKPGAMANAIASSALAFFIANCAITLLLYLP